MIEIDYKFFLYYTQKGRPLFYSGCSFLGKNIGVY